MNVLLLFKFVHGITLMRILIVLPYHHLCLCKFSIFQCLVRKIKPWAMPGLRDPKYWSELGTYKCATVSLITYRSTTYMWGMQLINFSTLRTIHVFVIHSRGLGKRTLAVEKNTSHVRKEFRSPNPGMYDIVMCL
jgi:hypothetical protein